jgi:hypothetical protein
MTSRPMHRGAVALSLIAVAMALPAVAGAKTVRRPALHAGVTKVHYRVRHTTGNNPPAILLSTRPASLRCSVSHYGYIVHEQRTRFDMRIRCPHARRGARARLVFGKPLRRVFRIGNGTGTVRVKVDKPRGDALPLARLSTRPRKGDCRIKGEHLRARPHHFTAKARVRCRDLPAHARGVLSVGGLIAADPATDMRSPRRAAGPRASSAAIHAGCEEPNIFTAFNESVSWKDCHTGPFTLGPWQSQWVGYIGTAPHFDCEAGWTRNINIIDTPAAWAAIAVRRTDVDLVTDPDDAYWWSWRLGLVTNWQFSGDITFWWKYRCFHVNRTVRG